MKKMHTWSDLINWSQWRPKHSLSKCQDLRKQCNSSRRNLKPRMSLFSNQIHPTKRPGRSIWYWQTFNLKQNRFKNYLRSWVSILAYWNKMWWFWRRKRDKPSFMANSDSLWPGAKLSKNTNKGNLLSKCKDWKGKFAWPIDFPYQTRAPKWFSGVFALECSFC